MNCKHAPSYAVDVYSFGVVLHHIITGEEPNLRTALRPLRYAGVVLRLPSDKRYLRVPGETRTIRVSLMFGPSRRHFGFAT